MRELRLWIGVATLQLFAATTPAQDTNKPATTIIAIEGVSQVASRPINESTAAQQQQELLRQKLAERDRLQREIAQLRDATKTPEQILVRVQMVEVNRTKLRNAGILLSAVDAANSQALDLNSFLLGKHSAAAAVVPKFSNAGVVGFRHVTIQNPVLAGMLDQLEQQGLARTIAKPAIVVLDGQPSSFKAGGEFPVPPVDDGGAATSKDFGTQCDISATLLGDGQVRLAIHPRVVEIDEGRGIVVNGRTVPALRVREANFCCNVELGRSILAVGLEQERRIEKNSWGFQQKDEVEQLALLVVATPELIP